MTAPRLRFLSHLRVGLAATLSGMPTKPTAEAAYGITVAGVALAGSYRLYGPGQVTGLDADQVQRCFPRDGTHDHEPNLFAHVELKSADLPWRFTPGGPVGGKLRPWLVLVVVEDGAQATLTTRSGGALPVLTAPVAELPSLADSWAWAHVQLAIDDAPPADLAALYDDEPQRFLARLVCPRQLEPRRRYIACVVPAFDVGRDAGLGLDVSAQTALADAWSAKMQQVTLPVYHAWHFRCGTKGDFESLADRLRPRVAPADLGVATLDVHAPGLGLPAVPTPLRLVGALCAPSALAAPAPTAAETALRNALGKVVNAGATLPLAAQVADPLLAPPCWGAPQAGLQPTTPWQQQLNQEPGWRAVAGLGADLVRSRQEAFAASAWRQLESVDQLQRSLYRDATKEAAHRRRRDRLARLAAGDGGGFLVFGRALCSTVSSDDRTFAQRLRDDTDLPPQIASAATARLAVRADRTRRRRKQPAVSAASITAKCITPGGRPDFAPRPGPGGRTLDSRMQPVDTSKLKTVAVPSQAGDPKLQALHPGRGATAAPPPPPPRGAPGIGKDLWDAADPARFLRRERRAGTQAGLELGLGIDGPLPARLAPALRFTTPLGALLAESRPEFLLPGHGKLAPDSIVTLAVNPAFVEAFLVGANDQWTSELIWREMPAALRATAMRRFWDCEDPGDQIMPIRQWSSTTRLGANATGLAGAGGLALLISGRLLERYPQTLLYAVRAAWSNGERKPVVAPTDAQLRWPDVIGELAPGMHFVIFFALSIAQANGTDLAGVDPRTPGAADPGWFFVLEEQAVAPRFGLDVPPQVPITAPAHWNELNWAQVTTTPATGPARHLSLAPPRGVKVADGITWAAGAAEMAWITLQRPFRVYLHASSMLKPGDGR